MFLDFSVYHFDLLKRNSTTIEDLERFDLNGDSKRRGEYDLGLKKNFEQFFGENAFLYFLPILPSKGI
jgi:hypothetical protein